VAWLAVGQVPVLLDETLAQRDPRHGTTDARGVRSARPAGIACWSPGR